MDRINYEKAVTARISTLIAEHGNSWKNCWIPVVEGVSNEFASPTYEKSYGGDVTEAPAIRDAMGIHSIGLIVREITYRGNPSTDANVARWFAFCKSFGSYLHCHGEREGEVMLFWKEINIGAKNRLIAQKEGKLKPMKSTYGIACRV